jgi:2-pyrone-4,6-dicarboxylate lactonase
VRIAPIAYDDMTDAQRDVHDAIASGPRGGVRGPLAVWLTRPDLAANAQALGAYCRYGTSLSADLSELLIMMTGRLWSAEYEWAAHKPFALKAGLSADQLHQIRHDLAPLGLTPQQQAVYDFASTLLQTRQVSDATYARALEALGQDGTVDMVGILGYYTLISMTINAFRVPPPEGATPEMQPRPASLRLTYNPTPSRPTLRLPAGACDTHVHVFGPQLRYPYPDTARFRPADAPRETLFALHDFLGIERCVIVQSACHGYDNTPVLDAIGAGSGRYLGVALAPLAVSDDALAAFAAGGIRGIRFNFMRHLAKGATPEQIVAFSARLAEHDLHLQVNMEPELIDEVGPWLRQACTPVVIDHMGRINAALGLDQPAFASLCALLEQPNFMVKVSGSERTSAQGAPYADAVPLARTLVERFPSQVLWGTDWPHANLAGGPPDDGLLVDLLQQIAPDEAQRHALLVRNPARFYRFT